MTLIQTVIRGTKSDNPDIRGWAWAMIVSTMSLVISISSLICVITLYHGSN